MIAYVDNIITPNELSVKPVTYKTTQMKTSNRSLLTGGLCMQVEIKRFSMVTIIITWRVLWTILDWRSYS